MNVLSLVGGVGRGKKGRIGSEGRRRGSALSGDLRFQPLRHAIERVESKGFADRLSEVGIRVDVVKYAPSVHFQILDTRDVETARRDQSLASLDRFRRDLGVGIKLHRL